MQLIDRSGNVRQACDRCHRVNVKIRRGTRVCEECRVDPCLEAVRKFAVWVDAYRNRIRLQA
jgi:hypothetical protein